MLREGPIPQALQGLLEYLVGALFVAAPFLLDFADQGVATAASITFGVVFLVVAATSESPTGLVKQLPPAVHAVLDVVLALLLVMAPFVLGFSGVAVPRNFFLISGVVWLLVTIGSRYGKKPTRPAAPVRAAPVQVGREQAGRTPLDLASSGPSPSGSSTGPSTIHSTPLAPPTSRSPAAPLGPPDPSSRPGTGDPGSC